MSFNKFYNVHVEHRFNLESDDHHRRKS